MILEELLAARKQAKEDLKLAKDPEMKAVLDGRQLALKISANSVYGFTGAQIGQLPCLEISSSVTSFGREMINTTKEKVEEHYSKENGFKEDAKVIYGDTDSVMVKFGVKSLEEAMKLGKEASEIITKNFRRPIKLEFEKVYYPYLLMNKKRYAGLIWTKLEKFDKIDTKGFEAVRRDVCGLVKETMNQILNKILVERNVKGAIEYIKDSISNLLMNKIDISLLVISKTISKKTDEGDDSNTKKTKKNTYTQKQAHVELAEKMKKRDEGNAPSIGDRVQYVIIKGAKGSQQYQNAEDPQVVLEKDLCIDTNYYLNNQLKKPLLRVFKCILPDAEMTLFCKINSKISRRAYEAHIYP